MLAATGNATVLALGRGRSGQPGVPAGGLIQFPAGLPIDADVIGEEKASGLIDPHGFVQKAVPSMKGGVIKWPVPMAASYLLEYLEHLFGKVTKTTLESGVYRYDFEPVIEGHVDTHFWGLLAKVPVEKALLYLIKFGSIEAKIGDNEIIDCTLDGVIGHGTLLGPSTQVSGTGTYTLGPWARGVAADPTLGSIWARVTRIIGGLQFKLLQSLTAPDNTAWAAATTVFDVLMDGSQATWQNAQTSAPTPLDIGLWGENKDPVEIIWPGLVSDHASLVIGDTFEIKMPEAWTTPALTTLAAADRYTSAHWRVRMRKAGDVTAYMEKHVNDGSIKWDMPVKADRGNSSRYPFGVNRIGPHRPTVELSRTLLDTFFRDRRDRHERLDVQMLFEGRQLGTGLYRESIISTYPSMAVTDRKAPAAKQDEIQEKVTLTAETNAAGANPNTVSVICARNYTLAT